MALDNPYPFAAHALPTPTDTPYQTPLRGEFPRGSSHHGSTSPFSETTPFNPGESFFSDRNSDGTTSLNNPRFSQNLDISFIGEIHSLKKEIERKELALELAQKESKRQKNAIGELEEAVDALDAQLTQLQGEAKARAAKERSLEQSKQLLQDDSVSAMDEMAEERDAAIQRERELRRQLESERTKKRSLETDLESAHRTQEQERQKYNIEARKMDRKHHVLESRIKTMVDQFSAVQANLNQQSGGFHGRRQSIQEAWSARGHENGSVRSDSRADSRMAESRMAESRMSMRNHDDVHGDRDAMNSRASARSNFRGTKMNGMSLAEELEGEDSDYEDDHLMNDENIPHSPNALPEEIYSRPVWSRQSRYSEDKARKVMGLPSETTEQDEFSGQHSMGIIMDYMGPSVRNSISQYVDAGTQPSPPPSPKAPQLPQLEKSLPMTPVEQTEEPAANQSRKRIAIPSIFSDQKSTVLKSNESKRLPMISSGCQTVEILPPKTLLKEASVQTDEPEPVVIPVKEMISVSTQTSDGAMPKSVPAPNRLSPMDIPVIAIHPPGSRPPSSHNSVVLPPRTKNAGSQVTFDEFKSTTSTSMQTESRVDRRPVKVPPKIRTAHISSRSRSPVRIRARSIEKRARNLDSAPPRIPRRNLRSPPPVEEEPSSPPVPNITDAYPGNNDNGPLSSQSPKGRRRPIRSESIFAGFDDTHDELVHGDNDYSDDEDDFTSAPPIRKTLSKVQDSWKLVPQSEDDAFDKALDSPVDPDRKTLSKVKDSWKLVSQPDGSIFDRLDSSTIEPETLSLGKSLEMKARAAEGIQPTTSKTFQPKTTGTTSQSATGKSVDIRRAALVSNGTSAHLQRARSPSEPGAASAVVAPPFPVPTRSSSRKIPVSASDGAASPSPYTTSFFSTRRAQDQGKPTKKKILRKVQSAAAVTRTTGPRLPPPTIPLKTSSSAQLQNPQMRRPSNNQFILPFAEEEKPESTRGSEVSDLSRSHAGEASIEAPSQQTTVVDAIAQTMVGEWMWKYVRKRTSFGITEKAETEFEMGRNGEAGANSGVRHKRWVWLAPYERSVIWSGKQPTSGPALLGKGGRKLMIQSVLDVKDDTPIPKGGGLGAAFDRSILILTPQRALKFTAVSRERHYIWLTALSFLSHSTQGMDDLAVPEPISQPAIRQQRPPSQDFETNPRRTHVRDSINIARGKVRPAIGSHSYSSPPGEPDQDTLGALGMSFDEIAERPSDDAAEPPVISRVTGHARKRSSTGPRIPATSFNSYPSSVSKASSFSLQGGVRDSYSSRGSIPSTVASRRGSGPGTRQSTMTRGNIPETTVPQAPLPVSNGFFDAVGTVRMEAFVDRTEGKAPERFKAKKEHHKKEHKKDMSYWGVPEASNKPPKWREQDPFRGF